MSDNPNTPCCEKPN